MEVGEGVSQSRRGRGHSIEMFVEDDMKLWGHKARARVSDKRNDAGVLMTVSNVDAQFRAAMPLAQV